MSKENNVLDIEVVTKAEVTLLGLDLKEIKNPLVLTQDSLEIAGILKTLIINSSYLISKERNYKFEAGTFDILIEEGIIRFMINSKEHFISGLENVISPFVDMSVFPILDLEEPLHEFEVEGVKWTVVNNNAASGVNYFDNEGREVWCVSEKGDMFPLEFDDSECIDISMTSYAFIADNITEDIKSSLLEEVENNIDIIL